MKNKTPIPQPGSPSKSFASPKNILSEKEHGFTLIEIIIVIIIVGILAAVGISQYGKMIEKGRSTEARMILGQIRTLAYQYRLENGTVTGFSDSDANIGSAADQIPMTGQCRSTHYFGYYVHSGATLDPVMYALAYRCTSGGKSPQGTVSGCYLTLTSNLVTGADTWSSNCGF